jgi:hypothetical protein
MTEKFSKLKAELDPERLDEAKRDALFDEYAVIKPEFDRLKKHMDELKRELKPYFKERGDVRTSSSGVQLRMDGRNQLDQEALERTLGRRFIAVSKRVAVSTLIKAAVLRGRIKQEEVDQCMVPTENWFKIL